MIQPPNNEELLRAISAMAEQYGADFAQLIDVVKEWQRRQVAGEKFATKTRLIAEETQQYAAQNRARLGLIEIIAFSLLIAVGIGLMAFLISLSL